MKKRSLSRTCITVAMMITTATIVRSAQANDPATAQALFDQARKLMTQDKWAEACPKLEESQRLDPGGGTLLHLALCREHEGKTATAWALYQDALSTAKRDGRKDRAKIAKERIDALAPRLPRLRIRVASRNRKISGFRVSRDDVNVGEAQWNEAYPVDPGTRTISASADGYKTWISKLEIAPSSGETSVDVPELEADASKAVVTPPPDEKPVEHKSSSASAKTTKIEDATRGDAQRTVGIVAGGVGGAALVIGGVFGALSISKQKDADAQCKAPDFTVCTAQGKASGDDGTSKGNISTIAFIVGGVFVASGAVLYFTAPDATTKVGVSPFGASLTHSF